MKAFITLTFLFYFFTCSGQTVITPVPPAGSEFEISENGLIYSHKTIKQLKHIVDSLNLKFRKCELQKTYYSLEQGTGHYVELEKVNVKAALSDIKKGISFEEFIKKYPNAKVHQDLLVIRSPYRNYEDELVVDYFSPNLGRSSFEVQFEVDASQRETSVGKNGWKIIYEKASEDYDETLYGFFLVNDVKAQPLVEKYARMVQYTDCMIDTTSQIFKDNASDNWGVDENADVAAFINYVDRQTSRPIYKDNDEQYLARVYKWDSTRFAVLDKLSASTEFKNLFGKALQTAFSSGISNEEFEEYVHRYKSAEAALELKRLRKVMGFCSQDDGPRRHALNIAKLSAEAIKWEVFLRAHLDIMNDRFERASDGSYAWAGRKTYVRELEVLDIDVISLLLGISLRISNESKNHYFGSIGRIGRALAETQTPEALETALLSMIKDNSLDSYNRILMIYLFDNYNYYLADKVKKEKNRELLKDAAATLPAHILSSMDLKKLSEE